MVQLSDDPYKIKKLGLCGSSFSRISGPVRLEIADLDPDERHCGRPSMSSISVHVTFTAFIPTIKVSFSGASADLQLFDLIFLT